MPTQRHTFGNTDLRYGVKLGPAMLTGERVKTARQNREINQFRLESAKEEKDRAAALRQEWLDVNSPEEAREMVRRNPTFGKTVLDNQKKMSDMDLEQSQRYFGTISMRLGSILELPEEQRPGAWKAAYQSLSPGMKKKVQEQYGEEYDPRNVVAMAREATGWAEDFKEYRKNKAAVAMEKQKQEGRIQLEKVKQRLKTAAKSGAGTTKEITSRIRRAVNDLFNKTDTMWDMGSEDTAGMDADRLSAHKISQEAIRMMRSGEQTEAYAAITAAAKKNGVDIEGNGLLATDENMKNTFLGSASAPVPAP